MLSKAESRKLKTITLQDVIVYLAFIFVLVLFFVNIGPRFLSARNIKNIAIQASAASIASAGMVMVISCGMIDLSIGAVASLSSVIIAMILRSTGSIPFSLLCGFAVGGAVGAINGVLITYGHLPPFLATLGMQSVIYGCAQWLTNMQAIPIYDKTFTSIFGLKMIFGVPILLIWSLLCFFIVCFIVKQTRLGNKILATGASESAATFTGINTKRVKICVMMINGFFAVFTGILASGRTMAARHNYGESITSTVIASVILGGTLMRGGKARPIGALFGILLLSMTENGLVIMDFSVSEQMIIKGIVMVLATLLGTVSYKRNKQERSGV